MRLDQIVQGFVSQALESGGWMALDRIYITNRVYSLLETTAVAAETIEVAIEAEDYLGALQEYQLTHHRRWDQLADLLTPPPSVVNALFAQRYEKDPYDATSYFYGLNQGTKRVLPVLPSREVASTYGALRAYESERLGSESQLDYPACTYCMANEGFAGMDQDTSQLTQRMIRMNLQGETWNYHFTPNQWWSEEAVFTSEHHDYQVALADKVTHMSTLNDLFPHYFIASMGDEVTHPRYIGGATKLPVMLGSAGTEHASALFKGVTLATVQWPVSTLRIRGKDSQLVKATVAFITAQSDAHGLPEPIVVFSDHLEAKQCDILFVSKEGQSELALGLLSQGQELEDFLELKKNDSLQRAGISLETLVKGV